MTKQEEGLLLRNSRTKANQNMIATLGLLNDLHLGAISAKTRSEIFRQPIEFGLVARGTLIAEVRDVGKFSPNIEIKHSFGLSPNVFPIGTGLPQCVALRVTYAN